MKLKWFKPEEFMMSGECVYDEMNPELLLMLDNLRDYANIPLKITSSFRNEEYCKLKDIPYLKTSQHNLGNAVDIYIQGMSAEQKYILIKTAFEIGFTGIGIYSDFIHLDVRPHAVSLWHGI
jgi:uncharacterized protein YcbK (DUF882 family)